MRNVAHRLRYLNTWPAVGGTVCGGYGTIGNGTLREEIWEMEPQDLVLDLLGSSLALAQYILTVLPFLSFGVGMCILGHFAWEGCN